MKTATTISSVSKRLDFITSEINKAENVVKGGIENLRKLSKLRRFKRETEVRYAQEIEQLQQVTYWGANLTAETITQNGRYALD